MENSENMKVTTGQKDRGLCPRRLFCRGPVSVEVPAIFLGGKIKCRNF